MALGRFGAVADGDCLLVRAYDRGGTLRALCHFVPWGQDGVSLDLMRRAPDAVNGAVEAMIVTVLLRSPELDVTQVSLNFVVLRSVLEAGADPGATRSTRLLNEPAAAGVAALADRVAVPGLREVPPDLGHPLPVLPLDPGPAARRRRDPARGVVPARRRRAPAPPTGSGPAGPQGRVAPRGPHRWTGGRGTSDSGRASPLVETAERAARDGTDRRRPALVHHRARRRWGGDAGGAVAPAQRRRRSAGPGPHRRTSSGSTCSSCSPPASS